MKVVNNLVVLALLGNANAVQTLKQIELDKNTKG
jgi:hypothetical protein